MASRKVGPLRGEATEEVVHARRAAILAAALIEFSQDGVGHTTLAQIRERSGASTGSIYHFFRDKNQIASALYLEGLSDYHRGVAEALSHADDAEAGITRVIAHHLGWVAKHEAWARYLFESRSVLREREDRELVRSENARLLAAISQWMKPLTENGELRRLPIDLVMVLLLGPAHEFARLWLRRRTKTSLEEARAELSAAAIRSLCHVSDGRSKRSAIPTRTSPAQGATAGAFETRRRLKKPASERI